MDIFGCIGDMDRYVSRRDWDGLEQAYAGTCQSLAGKDLCSKIERVNLAGYQTSLREGLEKAIDRAITLSAKAVYFEYDLDNDWQSAFFICQNYLPQSVGDEDWASDWEDTIDGPSLPKFGGIYEEDGFNRTDRAIGSTLYLIARTVATFGRAFEGLNAGELAVCMGFHDQEPIMRISEPSTLEGV